MNKAQKEVQKAFLKSEEEVLKELNAVYHQAQADVEKKIFELYSRKDIENMQSIIYQIDYQKAIKSQIDGILDNLNSEQFKTVAGYLEKCYMEGYTGTMYDLHSQGIPLIIPIDQAAVVRAVKLDSKIKGSMYTHLGENVAALKKGIAREISRGISSGQSLHLTAQNITQNMIGSYKNKKGSYAYAMRIARTEGHRIQVQSTMDAQAKAKKAGADLVKQWDSSLDGRTRETHRLLDGQIRELDEDFEVNGMSASAPGMFGAPSEDCNCRCALLQRARWALDQAELDTLKERAEYFGLGKTKDFGDYKQKYLKAVENTEKDSIIKLQADINKMITLYERKVLDAVPKKEGFFDFAAHGSSSSIEYGARDKVLSAREVARIIKHNESYNGEKIRLLSCSTGSTEDGFAQQLANALGVEVEAPNDKLYVRHDGKYWIGFKGDGKMITFKPRKGGF